MSNAIEQLQCTFGRRSVTRPSRSNFAICDRLTDLMYPVLYLLGSDGS